GWGEATFDLVKVNEINLTSPVLKKVEVIADFTGYICKSSFSARSSVVGESQRKATPTLQKTLNDQWWIFLNQILHSESKTTGSKVWMMFQKRLGFR
ncbi:MAG: hypothetical protein O3C20_20665, partial [Verrucomicrobia bacterium]|nr:hypothetical protein [Verrucomicrobiota bacterium]